jgi:hypothetical protein
MPHRLVSVKVRVAPFDSAGPPMGTPAVPLVSMIRQGVTVWNWREFKPLSRYTAVYVAGDVPVVIDRGFVVGPSAQAEKT